MPDLVDAFIGEALERPNSPAVERDELIVSYSELRALASRFAASIQEVAPSPGPRVLLAQPQSPSAYAGMIGTLMAGGTFCPVNVAGPAARNAAICGAFSPDVIAFHGTPPSFLDAVPATTPRIDSARLGTNGLDHPPQEYSEVAYVIFTSGSTGQPKGVKIGRSGFSHFLTVARNYFALRPGERWGQFSNLGYDLAVMDVFLSLTQGGSLVPLGGTTDHLRPAAAIKENRIEIWHSVPSVLELMISGKQLSSDNLASLRLMSFCGEPLLPRHLEALYSARPDLIVFNTYGTTETTGFNTINRLTSSNYLASCEAPTVALGEEVRGWTLSLQGGTSPDEGEIVVSSDHLSLGYWLDEERTRTAFRQLRVHASPERRSYFTGDWGVRKGKHLYFASRIGRQVKIRGERIELDEVDSALRDIGFGSAHTILVGDALHSFVELAGPIDVDRIRALLAKRLPFHAVPKNVRPLSALPRNPNGKIDAEALRALVNQ